MDDRQHAQLLQNLDAIGAADGRLAARVALPVEGDTASLRPDGTATYHFGRVDVPLHLGRDRLRALITDAQGRAAVAVLGAGVGEPVSALLRHTAARVVLWERDPWMLRLALANHDWGQAIQSGRLRIALGADLVRLAGKALWTWSHPVLAKRYRLERQIIADGLGEQRALLCGGELLVADLAAALQTHGVQLFTWEVDRLSAEELNHTVRTLRPAFAAAINYTDGLAEACASFGLPLMCWEIDPTTSFVFPPRRPVNQTFIYTYRQRNVSRFRKAGFPNVQHLPLAANITRRRPVTRSPEQQDRFGAPVSFVGASMVQSAQKLARQFVRQHDQLRPGAPPGQAKAALNAALDAQRQRHDYQMPAILEAICPGLRTASAQQQLADPAMLIGEVAAAEKRLRCVASLAPLGIRAWGDDGWRQLEGQGVRYMGYADHSRHLNLIYCASRVNVDVGRWYQADIVPMRIFDILACGGFVIAEQNTALAELFALGEEIETWQTLDELTAKVQHYLAHPQQAARIAAAGMRRVRKDHTIQNRVDGMLQDLRRFTTNTSRTRRGIPA
ncbi:MAG: glycosyltransferase [Myxococcota bacterium]